MTVTFEFSQSQGVCMLSLKGVESRMWNIPSLDLDLVFVYNNNLVHTGVISMHASEVLVWIHFEVLDLEKKHYSSNKMFYNAKHLHKIHVDK